MLVDDSEIDLKVNSRMLILSKLCSDIQTCISADSALEYLKLNSSNLEHIPNVILLDIQMPYLNGFDFLERFSELSQEVKNHCQIFILSSTLDFGDIKKAEANPLVTKLLKKPLNVYELSRHLMPIDITA